jgi:hypothetical protein
MIRPFSSAGDSGPQPNEDGFADRLLQRAAGSPGLVDAAAVQAGVVHRIEWLGRLFPILRRVLARAAQGEADGFTGSAPPLATPIAFGFGDLLSPLASPLFSRFADPLASPGLTQRAEESPSPLPPSVDSPQHLFRLSRVRLAGAAPTQLRPAATEPGAEPTRPSDGAGIIADAIQQRGAPAVSRVASLKGGPGPGTALVSGVQSVRELRVPRAGRGVETMAELFSTEAALPTAAGVNRAPTVRTSVVPELRAPGAGNRVEGAEEPFPSGAAFQQATGVNEAPIAPARVVTELRAPRAGYRIEAANEVFPTAAAFPPATGVNEAPLARTSLVPELPAHGPPRVPMELPASFGEMFRFAGESRPGAPLAPVAQVEANAAESVVPRPAIPAPPVIAGAELDRLAEKVSRVIARRVAVERERRGR